jgi:hypothetical protein
MLDLLPFRGWDDEVLAEHPDGKPWRKACSECAFRRSNPQSMTEEDFDSLYMARDFGGLTFVCAHREDEGHSRTCACWAAIEAGRRALDQVKGEGGGDG